MGKDNVVRAHRVEFVMGMQQQEGFLIKQESKRSRLLFTFCKLNFSGQKYWEPKMTIVGVRQGKDGRKAKLWIKDLTDDDLKTVI